MENYENNVVKNEKTEKVIMPDGHLESYEFGLEWDYD